MRSFRLGAVALVVVLVAACAVARTGSVPAAEIPTQPPGDEPSGGWIVPAPRAGSLDDGPVVDLMPDARTPELPISWRSTFGQTRPYADALRTARTMRATLDKLALGLGPDAGSKSFEETRSLLERSSRAYAAAYHAPDATTAGQIDTLREAAEMIFAWAQRLDDAGLGQSAAAYRTDPSVALTFEDVAHGPAERWRQEGMALVDLCIVQARGARIDGPASRRCGALRRAAAAAAHEASASRPAKRPLRDGGANGCACAFGDPLCSASMSGWCHPE